MFDHTSRNVVQVHLFGFKIVNKLFLCKLKLVQFKNQTKPKQMNRRIPRRVVEQVIIPFLSINSVYSMLLANFFQLTKCLTQDQIKKDAIHLILQLYSQCTSLCLDCSKLPIALRQISVQQLVDTIPRLLYVKVKNSEHELVINKKHLLQLYLHDAAHDTHNSCSIVHMKCKSVCTDSRLLTSVVTNKNLTQLSVHNFAVAGSVREFALGLSACTHLKFLSLSRNNIEHSEMLVLGPVLSEMALQSLTVKHNCYQVSSVELLASVLSKLKLECLVIRNLCVTLDKVFCSIQSMVTLKKLSAQKEYESDDRDYLSVELCALTNLTDLELINFCPQETVFTTLRSLNLRRLAINKNFSLGSIWSKQMNTYLKLNLTQLFIENLHFKVMEEVELEFTEQVNLISLHTVGFCVNLRSIRTRKLHTLRLEDAKIQKTSQLITLIQNNTGIRNISLQKNKCFNSTLFECISKLKGLKSLNISRCCIGNENVVHLLSAVKRLNIRHLQVCHNSLNMQSIDLLCKSLCNNASLESISVSPSYTKSVHFEKIKKFLL